MEERIFGTECEYALFHQPLSNPAEAGAGRGKLSGKALLQHLENLSALLVSALDAEDLPAAGQFLGNGGRFYIDRGGHPEYATPECRSVQDLVAHEKAGDRIVQRLVERARAVMAGNKTPGRLHVFKNNVDTHGNTYGSHENYLITKQAMERIGKIIPFLLTRQIFAGAGKIAGQEGPAAATTECAHFQLSQRADFFDFLFNDRTSETRGIINIRKREIPGQRRDIRLHIILGDSNMAEYALWLKIGTTAIVLRVLEEEGLDGVPMFSNPVEALKTISRSRGSIHDMEGRVAGHTALDIQYLYLERALKFFGSRMASREEKMLLDLWENTLVGLRDLRISSRTGTIEDDPGELRRKLDWVLKLWLLDRIRDKQGPAWSCPNLKHLDFKYHDLDPETGIFERCESLELVDRMVEEDKVCTAQTDPPLDTRGRMRAAIIRNAAHRNVEVIVKDWETIKLVPKGINPIHAHPFYRGSRLANGLKVDLKDPFESWDEAILERVSHFIDRWGG